MHESWRAALGARAHAQLAGNLGYRRLGSVLRMRASCCDAMRCDAMRCDAVRCELLRYSARTVAHLALDVMKMQADLPDRRERCKQATLWGRRQESASAKADAARRTRASPTLGGSARAAAGVRPAAGFHLRVAFVAPYDQVGACSMRMHPAPVCARACGGNRPTATHPAAN